MLKKNLDCIININNDELLTIIPVIGNICDSNETKLNIIKFNITNIYDKFSNKNNWTTINNICKHYTSLSIDQTNINGYKMPEFADIYFTTEYVPSHTLKRQYNKYVFIYHDIKQLSWTDKTKNVVESNNVRYFFQFDAIIILQDTKPSLREYIIKYYPDTFTDKINNFFNTYSFIPDRKCMQCINEIDPCKTIFDKTYTFGLWVNSKIIHKTGITANISFSGDGSDLGISDQIIKTMSDFIKNNGVTQIIDLSCGDMKWMSIVLKENKQITDYHGNDVSLNAIRLAQHNITNRDGLNISFSNCNTAHKLFAKNIGKILKGTSLIFSRLTLQHMTNQEIINTIRNLIKIPPRGASTKGGGKFSFFGLSSIKTVYNIRNEWIKQPSTNGQDINRGGYRAIDMDEPPYDNAKPISIFNDQVRMFGKNTQELIDVHFYNYAEFSKLKNIKSKFTKHNYTSYIHGGDKLHKLPKNKYKIYKIKKINLLLDKTDNIEENNKKRIWYTITD